MINKEKDVTGHTEESIDTIDSQYAVESFLVPLLDTISISPGALKYPLIDVILSEDTNYLVKDIELAKEKEYSEVVLTDETLEDSSTKVSIGTTLTKLLATKNLKALEHSIVNTMLTDRAITRLELAVTWPGITSAIVSMGSPVFSIEGSIYVVLSLPKYLDIIGSKEYSEASKVLKNKVVLVPSEHLEGTAMLVFHEYGVVGGVSSEKEYIQRKPALGVSIHSVVQTYTTGWDYSFIRLINVLRWQYNFDGIDDYIQLPTILLFTGDVVEFDFVANTVADTTNSYFIDSTVATSSRAYVISNSSNQLQFYDGTLAVKLDGVSIATGAVQTPTDGEVHHIEATVLTDKDVGIVGCRYNFVEFLNKVIKNLRITRANPTDEYPSLFFPIDDGPDATIVRQTLPTIGNWDGTYNNFNDERWERV